MATDGDDLLIGTEGPDTLSGLGGNDVLLGLGGNDTLRGGEGDDTLNGGTGRDVARGGNGNDTYFVDQANDQVIESSNAGYDKVYASVSYTLGDNVENLYFLGNGNIDGVGNSEHNYIEGNAGNNRIDGKGGDDFLIGGDGDDRLFGGSGHDVLYAGAGIDTLNGGSGDDWFYDLDVNDVLIEIAGGGHDTAEVYAAAANSTYHLGANVEDLFISGQQNLIAHGNNAGNQIFISSNGGTAYGEGGNDDIFAQTSETLYGGNGNDTLRGNSNFANNLYGEAGRDYFTLADTMDTASGGSGRDSFEFLWGNGTDRSEMVRHVADFDAGAGERIIFMDRSNLMDEIPFGTVANKYFYAGDGAGAVAQTADHHYIYDRLSGELYYDSNGNGIGGTTLIGDIQLAAGQLSASNLFKADAWGED